MTDFTSPVVANVAETKAGYAKLRTPDPACCLACASWVRAVEMSMVPSEFAELLVRAGADVGKPLEVWGEPQEGFLEGFFVVAGRLAGAPWAGQGKGAFREPLPGFKYYVTEHVTMNDPVFDGIPSVQIEFTWQGGQVKELGKLVELGRHRSIEGTTER